MDKNVIIEEECQKAIDEKKERNNETHTTQHSTTTHNEYSS